jgi:hypothetical protein
MFISCVPWVLLTLRPLQRADPSFSGVLPVVCVCLIVCDLETSIMRWPRRDFGCCTIVEKEEEEEGGGGGRGGGGGG